MQRRTRRSRPTLKKTSEECAAFIQSPKRRIMFFDEGRFGLKPTLGRAWAKRGGGAPRVSVLPGYRNFYLYSAVDPFSGEHFTLLLPWVNTDMMNFYLRSLAEHFPDERIWVILDRAGWHLSKKLRIPSTIRLIYLPPYSPELNPVERLWRWLRRSVCRNKLYESLEDMELALCNAIRSLLSPFLLSLCHCSYMHNNN
jgi:transposase